MQPLDQIRQEKISSDKLVHLACKVLDTDAAEMASWSFAPIGQSSVGEGTALYRITGEANWAGKSTSWNVVLKVLCALPDQSDPSAWYYWQREAKFYSSRLNCDLEALQPAHCYLVEEQSVNGRREFWLWLEDLGEFESASWSIDDFGFAAAKIGEFNGQFLGASALPEHPWLCKDGIVSVIGQLAPLIDRLIENKKNPNLLNLLGEDEIERYLWHWEKRSKYIEMLRFPPQTLCHFDANRRNLFLNGTSDGSDAVVAIDWSYVGYGAIGAEMAIFIIDTLLMGTTSFDDIERFESFTIGRYISGLMQAGWTGNADMVRLGYTSGVIYYRLGGLRILLDLILSEERRKRFEATTGLPLAAMLEHIKQVGTYLDGLLVEAASLYDRLQ
jgi:hypothetical protein